MYHVVFIHSKSVPSVNGKHYDSILFPWPDDVPTQEALEDHVKKFNEAAANRVDPIYVMRATMYDQGLPIAEWSMGD